MSIYLFPEALDSCDGWMEIERLSFLVRVFIVKEGHDFQNKEDDDQNNAHDQVLDRSSQSKSFSNVVCGQW